MVFSRAVSRLQRGSTSMHVRWQRAECPGCVTLTEWRCTYTKGSTINSSGGTL